MRIMPLFCFGVAMAMSLAACNGPSPRLAGTTGQRVEVGGASFIVYHRGDRAEAVRTNFEFPANVRSVFPRAITAMEQVSGCRVVPGSAVGDPALIKADLDCS